MSQPIHLKPPTPRRPAGQAEITAKARALGWSSDELDTLLFTYGHALSLDEEHHNNETGQPAKARGEQ